MITLQPETLLHSSKQTSSVPRLPRPLALLLRVAPRTPPAHAAVFFLNRLLAQPLRGGELDWLQCKVVRLVCRDAEATLSLTLRADRRLVLSPERERPDLVVEGLLFDFLSLAAGRVDSDTLFFHRRLHLQGDVELGLYLKNFIDGFEPDPAQRRVLAALRQMHSLLGVFGDFQTACGAFMKERRGMNPGIDDIDAP